MNNDRLPAYYLKTLKQESNNQLCLALYNYEYVIVDGLRQYCDSLFKLILLSRNNVCFVVATVYCVCKFFSRMCNLSFVLFASLFVMYCVPLGREERL